MMATSIGNFEGLDRRRLELAQNVEKLSKSLRYWQTWEAEYEGLKEELHLLGEKATAKEIQAVVDDFGGDILTPTECREIINTTSGATRDCAQILNILQRRIDYVRDNVRTVQKQLASTESNYEAVTAAVEVQPRDEDGLPLHEITEILDDDDNVISSSVADPVSTAPEILEVLRKSGVTGASESTIKDETTLLHKKKQIQGGRHSDSQPTTSAIAPSTSSEPESLIAQAGQPKPATRATQITEPPSDVPSAAKSTEPRNVHEKVLESLNNDFPSDVPVPAGESAAEAALRREMLQYSMNEVGAVVATIDLDDENMTDDDTNEDEDGEVLEDEDMEDVDEDEDAFDDDTDDEGEEPEDAFGRTSVRVIDDDYRQEMLELEARLNAKALMNMGPDFKMETISEDQSASDNPAPAPETKKTEDKPGLKKKGVRFAETLDIAEPSTEPVPYSDNDTEERPILDTIVERGAPTLEAPAPTKPKRTSRFSAMRAEKAENGSAVHSKHSSHIQNGPLASMQSSVLTPLADKSPSEASPHQGDLRKTHSHQIIERPMGSIDDVVTEPDEYDPALLRQQATLQYHDIRNRLIQRNGGFVARGENEEDEEEHEPPKKMSRFKAARIQNIVK